MPAFMMLVAFMLLLGKHGPIHGTTTATASETETTGLSQTPPENEITGSSQPHQKSQTTGPSQIPPEIETTGSSQKPPENETTGSSQPHQKSQTTRPSQIPPEIETTGSSQTQSESKKTGPSQTPPETETTGSSQAPPENEITGSSQAHLKHQTTGPSHTPPETETTGSSQTHLKSQTTGPSQTPPETETTGSSQTHLKSQTTGPSQIPPEIETTGSSQTPPATKKHASTQATVSKVVPSEANPGSYTVPVASLTLRMNFTVTVALNFSATLTNRSSQAFIDYSKKFKESLRTVYAETPGFQTIEINSFRKGSVKCDYDVVTKGAGLESVLESINTTVVKKMADIDIDDAIVCEESLQEMYHAVNDKFRDKDNVLVASCKTESGCKLGFDCLAINGQLSCQSPCDGDKNPCIHGECVYDAIGEITKCRCYSDDKYSYTGPHCGDKVEKLALSSTYIIAISAGSGGAVILILTIIIVVLCVKRKRRNRKASYMDDTLAAHNSISMDDLHNDTTLSRSSGNHYDSGLPEMTIVGGREHRVYKDEKGAESLIYQPSNLNRPFSRSTEELDNDTFKTNLDDRYTRFPGESFGRGIDDPYRRDHGGPYQRGEVGDKYRDSYEDKRANSRNKEDSFGRGRTDPCNISPYNRKPGDPNRTSNEYSYKRDQEQPYSRRPNGTATGRLDDRSNRDQYNDRQDSNPYSRTRDDPYRMRQEERYSRGSEQPKKSGSFYDELDTESKFEIRRPSVKSGW